MILRYVLLFTLSSFLLAQEVIHSSLSAYGESKTYTGSKQKEKGTTYGIGADLHFSGSEIKIIYEQSDVKTIKSPSLTEDLEVQKLFFKYAYRFDKNFELNVNYINILRDNLAETDGGLIGGGGLTYYFDKKWSINFTQYFSDYSKFDTFQSDLNIEYKIKIAKAKVKFTSLTKYIYIEDGNISSGFTPNAKKSYATTGIKVYSYYNSYHLNLGAFFGKRAFAIMNDGFKIQHHAMEFDRTYTVGGGKTFGDFVVRGQYIYQRATELPSQTKDVTVSNFRLITNYKF